jgi:hypothetical protein
MKKIHKITIELTKEEVQDALLAYILSKSESGLTHIDNIDPITNSVEIPGFDPHDCDYVEEFAGITVTGT